MTQQLPGAGEIRRDAIYTVAEFCRRTKINRHTVRKYIKPRHIAGKGYVIGREFCELVESQPDRLPHEESIEPEIDCGQSRREPAQCP